MNTEDRRDADRLPHRLHSLFREDHVESKAKDLRNPYSDQLRAHAEQIMEAWRSRFPGIKTVLGGSLGADLMTGNSYDLDLRILLPAGMDEETDFKRISAALAAEVDFDWRRTDLENYSVVYHHSMAVRIEGIPEAVSLTMNIVRESEYYGLAGLNLELPQLCRDRYLVAKHKAAVSANATDYEAVKAHWGEMIASLQAAGFFEAPPEQRAILLAAAATRFPLFLEDFLPAGEATQGKMPGLHQT